MCRYHHQHAERRKGSHRDRLLGPRRVPTTIPTGLAQIVYATVRVKRSRWDPLGVVDLEYRKSNLALFEDIQGCGDRRVVCEKRICW